MKNLSNVSLRDFRAVLSKLGLELKRTKGGHEVWMRDGMTRPVIVQTHVDPIPEFVIQNDLRTIGIDKKTFLSMLEYV